MAKIFPSAMDFINEHLTGKGPKKSEGSRYDPEFLKSEMLRDSYDTADRKTWLKNSLQDDQSANGMMWDENVADTMERAGFSPISVPIIPEIVEFAVGMLTHNAPAFQATGREDSDNESAAFGSDLMSWIIYNSRGRSEIKRFAYDAYVRSMGALLIYPDPVAREVYIKALNPHEILMPPSSKDKFGQDADHIIIRTFETERQLSLRHTEIDFAELRKAGKIDIAAIPSSEISTGIAAIEGQNIDTESTDPDTIFYEILDRYTRVKVEFRYIWDPRSGFERTLEGVDHEAFLKEPAILLKNAATEAIDVVLEEEEVLFYQKLGDEGGGFFHLVEDPQSGQAQMVPGPEDEQSVQDSTVLVGLVTMKNLIDQGYLIDEPQPINRIKKVESAGGHILWNDILPKITDYPVVLWMPKHNRNPYPVSLVRLGRSLASYINKLRERIITHTNNSTGTTLLLSRAAGIDPNDLEARISRPGTKVIGIPADEDIHKVALQLQPLPLSSQVFADMETAKRELRDLFGVYTMAQGDASNAPITSRGTAQMDEFGQRRTSFMLDDMYEALSIAGRICMQYAQAIYTEHKVIRLFQPNNKPKTVEINAPVYDEFSGELIRRINDVQLTNMDLIVIAQSTLPSNRWMQLRLKLDMWKEGVLRDDETILRDTDIRNIDDVIANHGLIARLQQQLQGTNDELQKTQETLTTTEKELTHARMQTELVKFKEDLKGDRGDLEVEAEKQNLQFENVLKEMQASFNQQGQT